MAGYTALGWRVSEPGLEVMSFGALSSHPLYSGSAPSMSWPCLPPEFSCKQRR